MQIMLYSSRQQVNMDQVLFPQGKGGGGLVLSAAEANE